jgi:hypothetical protein
VFLIECRVFTIHFTEYIANLSQKGKSWPYMFTIIGADQKQYGPVSADEIRQWIREGRADGRTLAKQEGTTEWKTLAEFPEFSAAFASAPSAAMPPFPPNAPPAASLDAILARDYDLDIFGCISRAWDLGWRNFGPVVGISLLVFLGEGLANQLIGMISGPSMEYMIQNRTVTPIGVELFVLTSLLMAPIQGIFLGGLYKFYIKLVRGERAEIGDAFYGFTQPLAQLAMVGLMMNIIIMIGTLLCLIPGIYLSVALIFSMPLIVDKGLTWQEAMKLSMKMVNKHWFVVFGLILVNGLLAISGVIACCIGVLFTGPVAGIALMYAYEDIFGRQNR